MRPVLPKLYGANPSPGALVKMQILVQKVGPETLSVQYLPDNAAAAGLDTLSSKNQEDNSQQASKKMYVGRSDFAEALEAKLKQCQGHTRQHPVGVRFFSCSTFSPETEPDNNYLPRCFYRTRTLYPCVVCGSLRGDAILYRTA